MSGREPIESDADLSVVERFVGTREERRRARRARSEESLARAKARKRRGRGEKPQPAPEEEIPADVAGILERYAVAPSRVDGGNEVQLLVNGGQAYPAMLEAIRGARHYIDMETYIFESDDVGWTFVEALADRAAHGVEVNLMYDGLGCTNTAAALFEALEWAGVRLLEYQPPKPWRSRWGLQRRNHRKILVVDGHTGFTGGINIGDEYGPRSEEKSWGGWRDTHVRVRGPSVLELERLFDATWRREGGAELAGGKGPDAPRHPPPKGVVDVDQVGNTCVDVLGNSLSNRRAIRRAYIHAFRRARRRIWIANAYFVPDLGIKNALVQAADRGVDVRVMIPAESDVEPVWFATRALVGRLLARGIRVFEWLPSVLHTKTAVIDSVWGTVGSYNIDNISLLNNLEANVVIYDWDFGHQMEKVFEKDIESCREIDPGAWKNRPLDQRAYEQFWWLFRRWL